MNDLIIAGNLIHFKDGLYSLNDLHKSSGGLAKNKPIHFTSNDQTQALIKELENENSKGRISYLKTVKGKHGGTYACKELVYAYAMWINPGFHLAVIRAFDMLVSSGNEATAKLIARHEKKIKELKQRNKSQLEMISSQADKMAGMSRLNIPTLDAQMVSAVKHSMTMLDSVKSVFARYEQTLPMERVAMYAGGISSLKSAITMLSLAKKLDYTESMEEKEMLLTILHEANPL
jgi:hypothetical protein